MFERLSWYYKVMDNRAPAKFLICRKIQGEDPTKLDIEGLWDLHRALSKDFDNVFKGVKRGELDIGDIPTPRFNFLDIKVEIAKNIFRSCHFCERRCEIDRSKIEGDCKVDHTYVHSWFLHCGEEAPLVPSGTIFYGGCNFHCVFCQNYDISHLYPKEGIRVRGREVALIEKKLRLEGAKNINHVGGDPIPNTWVILESFKYLDVNVPQLWNSNMYCSIETMTLLREVIDIWLPDFKYGSNRCAQRLSLVENYWETITRNMKIAYNSGDMIVRHLVLPNHIECCSKPVLNWIRNNCPEVLVNIMGQYRPEYLVAKYPEMWPDIGRTPTLEEMEEVYRYAERLGITYIK
ncbi:MAG TPA: 4Fe-4S cluster-binding domain-containing protein [Methanothermococcus okinawensis]|uniref:4Fe-4S cluster-binding domain-containing protein n=1 Tax=Methanothermococcus okinawensis TaxID=155863 RepID=A0A832ZBT2_9EURY|nr:4Fe-4S cluster-binding domain-containing protein [Methanothermococcus okinawensis]